MGMDWLKGMVGASDRMIPAGQQPPPAWTPYNPQAAQGAPPAPQAYGAPPGYAVPPSPYATPAGPPIGGAPPPPAYVPPAFGAPPQPPPAFGAAPQPPQPPQPSGAADPRVAALEAQCAELRHDIESIAVFARTLLTLLEDKQITTPEQFAETRKKIEAQKSGPA
jgi:hypothetical protein